MHKLLWIIFIFSLNGSTCFGLSIVHHQEQHSISCTEQLVHASTSGCSQTYWHECCSWWWTNDSPKHVEPFNEKIKTIHKNLCISFVYIHTAIWCTVHTTSNGMFLNRNIFDRTMKKFLVLCSQPYVQISKDEWEGESKFSRCLRHNSELPYPLLPSGHFGNPTNSFHMAFWTLTEGLVQGRRTFLSVRAQNVYKFRRKSSACP